MTDIPHVLTVWENGDTTRGPWNDLTDVRYDGVMAVYKYCPIRLSMIRPFHLQKAVVDVCMRHQVSTIKEEVIN